MKVSKKWLQTYFDDKLMNTDELVTALTFHAFEIENVEKVGEDDVLDIKVLPDRAHYALSHKGIASEVSAITGLKLKQNRIPSPPKPNSDKIPDISIEDTFFCRRYIGCYVEIGDIPTTSSWSCAFLEAVGQRSINSLVDAVNMNMLDVGQPMHIFDADKVSGRIVIRKAREGEIIQLLDSSEGQGKELVLSSADHVIADDIGPLAVAGIKGGKRAGVNSDTKNIIIESANFEPSAIRRTSTRLGIRNDSSKRFENEITSELAKEAINNLLALINETCPNAKFGPIVDHYPTKPIPSTIIVDTQHINQRLGTNIDTNIITNILESLRIAVSIDNSTKNNSTLKLSIPFDRLDLNIPQDIVEEVGRIYGYENVIGELPPSISEKPELLKEYSAETSIKNILIGLGMSEVKLYSFVAKGDIEISYPLSKDKAFLRTNLTGGLINCLEKNLINIDLLGQDAIKIFEIGNIYNKTGEFTMLAIGIANSKKKKNIDKPLLKDIIDGKLGDKCTKVVKGNCSVYEMSLETAIGYFLNNRIAETVRELNLSQGNGELVTNYGDLPQKSYAKISIYPFMVRDVAVFVPEGISSDEVWRVIDNSLINSGAKSILARYSLFDTFKKDNKISFAFRMVFQAMNRTLTDDEVNKIMNSIYSDLKNNSWEIR